MTASDDKWLDALAGRAADEPEAQAVRRALLAEEHAAPRASEEPARESAEVERLLFRLRREGLLERPFLSRIAVPAALAAVLVLGLILVMRPAPLEIVYDEPPRLRGAIDLRVVTSESPRQDAEQLAAALKASGVAARIYQQEREFIVDFHLPAIAPGAALEALRRSGVAPRGGDDRIVFRPAP